MVVDSLADEVGKRAAGRESQGLGAPVQSVVESDLNRLHDGNDLLDEGRAHKCSIEDPPALFAFGGNRARRGPSHDCATDDDKSLYEQGMDLWTAASAVSWRDLRQQLIERGELVVKQSKKQGRGHSAYSPIQIASGVVSGQVVPRWTLLGALVCYRGMNERTEGLIRTSTTLIRLLKSATDFEAQFADLDGVADFSSAQWKMLGVWATNGWPVVRLPADLARQFEETDPPDRDYEDDFKTMVIEVEAESLLVGFHTQRDAIDATSRMIRNVWYVLAEHLDKSTFDGIRVDVHTPSAKANKKRGRKYYPGVEYIIGPTRKIHLGEYEPQERSGGERQGWTLSTRTLVKGFWRHQAHGPQHSLRKVIWVQPYWRGPDDAPPIVTTTEIVP
mgnify:CR=1 FL=1